MLISSPEGRKPASFDCANLLVLLAGAEGAAGHAARHRFARLWRTGACSGQSARANFGALIVLGRVRPRIPVLGDTAMNTVQREFQHNSPIVAGEFLASTSLGEAEHINPATGSAQATVHVAGAREIDLAAKERKK